METRDGWRLCYDCLKTHNYCEICGSISYEPFGDRETEQIHYDTMCYEDHGDKWLEHQGEM